MCGTWTPEKKREYMRRYRVEHREEVNASQRRYYRKRRQRLTELGLCLKCGKAEPFYGRKYCADCLYRMQLHNIRYQSGSGKEAEWYREWTPTQNARLRARYAERKAAGICTRCGKRESWDGRVTCKRCNYMMRNAWVACAQRRRLNAPEKPETERRTIQHRPPVPQADLREFIAGLDVQLTDGCEILKDRLNLIPNGWRNFRLAQATVSRLMDKIYETLPDKTLRHMARLCANGEIVIRPKSVIPRLDDAQIVLNEDLRVLVNHAMAAECAMCLKDAREQKKCELRQAMENVAPTAEIHKNGLCSYVDVAAAHGLGDYFGEAVDGG